jgi:hypothetical protein
MDLAVQEHITNTQNATAPTHFLLFPRLPLELRVKIWAFAHRTGLVHVLWLDNWGVTFIHRSKLPATLACREARDAGLKIRKRGALNLDIDILYIRPFRGPVGKPAMGNLVSYLTHTLRQYSISSLVITYDTWKYWKDSFLEEFLLSFPGLTKLLVVTKMEGSLRMIRFHHGRYSREYEGEVEDWKDMITKHKRPIDTQLVTAVGTPYDPGFEVDEELL